MPAVVVIDVTVDDDDDGVHWYSSSYCVVSTIDDCVVRMSWTDGVVVDVVS
jgi:hypothetical protein